MHEVLVNRLGGLSLPRNSVVRLADRPDMILDVYRGRKITMQQHICAKLYQNRSIHRGMTQCLFLQIATVTLTFSVKCWLTNLSRILSQYIFV